MTGRRWLRGKRAAQKALGWGLWTVAAAGCSPVVTVVEGTTPHKLQRRKLVADAPAYRGEWRVSREGISGQLDWQTCERQLSWTTSRVRVTRSPRMSQAGAVLVGAGSLLGVVALATVPEPEKICGFYGCQYRDPDLTKNQALAGAGLGLLVAGGVMMLVGGRTQVERLPDTPGESHSVGPCLSERELADLLLVLNVGAGQLWPVRLEPSGGVRVLVPEGSRVPPDTDLKLVVYRAPAGASELSLARGTVLARLRLETPAPPAPPAGSADFPSEAP
jgi:hypothetical protein